MAVALYATTYGGIKLIPGCRHKLTHTTISEWNLWGRLREVVAGTPEGTIIPDFEAVNEKVVAPELVEIMRKYGGRLAEDFSTSSAKLVGRWGVKKVITCALLSSTVGLLFMIATFGVDTSYPVLLISMIFMGIGSGTITAAATDSAMSTVPISKAGVGSATNNAVISLGGALGVAVLGAIMNGICISELHKYEGLNLLPLDVYNTIMSSVVGHISLRPT